MSDKRAAYERGEQLRSMADAAERRADTALRTGQGSYNSERQTAHTLRGEASKAYSQANVRLTPLGKPFGPDIPKQK